MNTKTLFSFVGVIAVLLVAFYFLNKTPAGSMEPPPPPPPPQIGSATINKNWNQLIKDAAGPPLGNPTAPWTIIECGDFECPNCGKARPVVEKLIQNSGGKVRLYFVNFPLTRIHKNALAAAEASLAANAQGKFWPMYNMLYSHQDELVPSEIQYYASTIPGLNTKQLGADITSQKYEPAVADEAKLVMATGVEATPTFFVRATSGGTASFFVGLNGQKAAGGQPATKGLQELIAAAPWNGKAPVMANAGPTKQPGT